MFYSLKKNSGVCLKSSVCKKMTSLQNKYEDFIIAEISFKELNY